MQCNMVEYQLCLDSGLPDIYLRLRVPAEPNPLANVITKYSYNVREGTPI